MLEFSLSQEAVPGVLNQIACLAKQVRGPGSSTAEQNVAGDPQSGLISQQVVESMKASITSDLRAERVDIKDAYGDGRHVSIDVVASAFEVSDGGKLSSQPGF